MTDTMTITRHCGGSLRIDSYKSGRLCARRNTFTPAGTQIEIFHIPLDI